MDNLCTSCLCADRKLYFLSETGFEHLYTQMINEVAVYNITELCVRICWECKALLRKVANFKEQVKTCYMELLQYLQQNTVKQFIHFSRLQKHQNGTMSYPQVTIKKDTEEYSFIDGAPYVDDGAPYVDDCAPYVDDVTCTNNDDIDVKAEETHCEPETFVNDLNMDEIKKRMSGKRRNKNTDKQLTTHSNLQNNQNETHSQLTIKRELEEYSFVDDDTPYVDDVTPYVDDVTPYVDDVTCTNNDDIDMKAEETHCEPETFVNDLNMDEIKKRNSVKRGDKLKQKSKNKTQINKLKGTKRKVKLKNISSELSQDVINKSIEESVIDSTVDCYKQDETKMKELTDNIQLDIKDEIRIKLRNCKITNDLPNAMNNELAEKPVCVECGKTFSSRKTYRYHLNVLHKGQNRYPCPRCGKVYQWKSNLGRHMRSHKARDSGELYCETCDKRFASVATFRQHLRISRRHVSESEFSFICNECGKKFVSKTRLRDHIDWEHLKKIKFKCQPCNKAFKCHTSLYVHMQNVHRRKDKKDNLCHVCGKSYQNAAKLKYHIVAMHTSETPYQCQQCNAAFGWYSSLYRHVREVHYKLKVQPKKSKKQKKSEVI